MVVEAAGYDTRVSPVVGVPPEVLDLDLALTLTPDTSPPAWPAEAALTPSEITETGVALSWPAATDDTAVTGYHLFQNGTLIADIEGSPPPTSHAVTGLSPDTAYTFTVEAHDGGTRRGGQRVRGRTLDHRDHPRGHGHPAPPTTRHVTPTWCRPSRFTDIAGNTHADNIACIVWFGLTQGTTPTTYSPSAPVRRDQMGSFLARVLDRGMEDGHVTHPTG